MFRRPGSHDVEKYATAWRLEPGSDEWFQLFDLAAAERGQVPEDIMSDEELVDKLPVLFRTMRATQVSPEKCSMSSSRRFGGVDPWDFKAPFIPRDELVRQAEAFLATIPCNEEVAGSD